MNVVRLQSCQLVTLKKKVLLSLKKHFFRWKKSFLPAERASRARNPFGGVQGPLKGPGSSQVFALWCNLSLIFEHFYSKTHQFFINNVCKFQNFHSPVNKKQKRIFAGKNVQTYFTPNNWQNTFKTYYLAALRLTYIHLCSFARTCHNPPQLLLRLTPSLITLAITFDNIITRREHNTLIAFYFLFRSFLWITIHNFYNVTDHSLFNNKHTISGLKCSKML